MKLLPRLFLTSAIFCIPGNIFAADPEYVWPDLAPGETLRDTGTILPKREGEKKKITRVEKIRRPSFTVHIAPKPNGAGVVILPGGGFGKVVPDFAILVYPWRIYDPKKDDLIEGVSVSKNCPPTFLVHTGDDRSSSLGAVLFYAGLKRHGIPAELHVYGNGGHGYGLRPVEGSEISSWPGHGASWLARRLAGKE